MEAYGGRAPETFSDPVPDMVKQFVVYLYRHIRYSMQTRLSGSRLCRALMFS